MSRRLTTLCVLSLASLSALAAGCNCGDKTVGRNAYRYDPTHEQLVLADLRAAGRTAEADARVAADAAYVQSPTQLPNP